MASYSYSFSIVILTVFYFMMNLQDNVNCRPPNLIEINTCKANMALYCGNDLGDAFRCAKQAILTYRHTFQTFDRDGKPLMKPDDDVSSSYGPLVPGYIREYFKTYVCPFIVTEDVITPEGYCTSDDFLDPLREHYHHRLMRSTMHFKDAFTKIIIMEIKKCKDNVEFMKEHTSLEIIMKADKSRYVRNKHAIKYLEVYARGTKLAGHLSEPLLSPNLYCERFEIIESASN